MKSWTLLSMAWLLVLGAPSSSLAEMAGEEIADSMEVQVEGEPSVNAPPDLSDAAEPSAEVVEATEAEAEAVDVVDVEPLAAAAPAADPVVADPVAANPVAANPVVPSPVAPETLDPARPLPARNGSVAFGPLGVDSEGRTGRIHLVARGDTLWDISDAYLGTPWVWPSVWNENSEIANPHLIVPGDRIWISSTEMRRVTELEAEALMAAAVETQEEVAEETISEDDLIEAVPAALDDMPMSVPMEVTGPPAPEKKKEMVTIEWKESMGFISEDQFKATTSIVGSPSIRNWLGQGDTVFLGLGAGQVEVGDQFMIFEEVESVRSLKTEQLLGYHINNLGWAQVTKVSAESSVAEIRESWYEIERGARVVPRPDPTVSFEIQPAANTIEGNVIFTPSDRTVMGTIDHVYLDIGAQDGLSVGSQLNVIDPAYESYDAVRGDDVVVPAWVYAQLVIVSTHPHSSVALVTHTRREIEVGQIVRGASE